MKKIKNTCLITDFYSIVSSYQMKATKTYKWTPEDFLKSINIIRIQTKLPKITPNESITKYAKSLSSKKPIKWKDNDQFVTISNMNFTEILDENKSADLIVSSWMNSSSRRPVILAPGDSGAIVFSEHKNNTYVSVVIMSFFK